MHDNSDLYYCKDLCKVGGFEGICSVKNMLITQASV